MKLTKKSYERESHSIWRAMYTMQMDTIKKYDCVSKEILKWIHKIGFDPKKIPNARNISRKLIWLTWWSLCDATSPFMTHDDWFSCLINKKFPVTNYIRKHKDILYTPLPDMFHEYFWHMPQMSLDFFANLEYKMARIHQNAISLDLKIKLYDFSWWTIEYWVLMEDWIPKAVWAWLLSSPWDLRDFVDWKFELKRWTLASLISHKPSPHQQHKFLFYFESLQEWDTLLDEYVAFSKKQSKVKEWLPSGRVISDE